MSWAIAKRDHDVVTQQIFQTHAFDLFHEVRFASMTMEELAALTTEFGSLFSVDEYQSIIQLIVLQGSQHSIFNTNPRQIQWWSSVIECD